MNIQRSIQLAVRHPENTAELLARTLSRHLGGAPWIDRATKLRFCTLFVANSIDGSVERAVDQSVLERLEKKPLTFGIRYLRRDPHTGLRVLVALVMRELRERQKMSVEEQRQFYEALMKRFFPDVAFVEE